MLVIIVTVTDGSLVNYGNQNTPDMLILITVIMNIRL